MAKYSFLEPIQVGGITLKNRVILSAMVKNICDPDGYVNEEYIAYYENFAKNGVSLITPGIMPVEEFWPYIAPGEPRLDDDRFLPGLTKFVDRIHAAGAKITFQPWNSGEVNTGIKLETWTTGMIHHIQDRWVEAAARAKRAGADGIEFHLAHTYLACAMLSPYLNHRTDEYGAQNLENAIRFSVEIIDRIREQLADDHFIITCKLNASDCVEGGITPEYAAQAAKILEQHGVCMITVNAGGRLTDITGMSDDGKRPEGWKVPFAETVKKAVSIPVAACGSIRHPDFADQVIREGKADLIALGRGLLAEPEWLTKCIEGREDELRMCISCMYCFGKSDPGVSGCSVNPWAKRELIKPELKKDGAGRKVIIVGSGPSGLEAAVTLAERGFQPVVYEKKDYMGGQTMLASIPPDKQKIGWLIDYYERQFKRLDVPVHINTEVTPELVKKENPYAVIVAAGSNEFIPPIPGLDSGNVIGVRKVLEEKPQVSGKNIVVLGGGLTGAETARMLKHMGNEVTVLEMLPRDPKARISIEVAIKETIADGVIMKYQHKVMRVTDTEVIAQDLVTGEEVSFPADMVVLSLGIRPNDKLYHELIAAGVQNVVKVGDCDTLGKIVNAVQAGCDAGYALK